MGRSEEEKDAIDRNRREIFDKVANFYNEVRPGYPEALIEDIITLSAIPSDASILEVGCGPGNATLPFARRGYQMLCLELGPRLTAIARNNCKSYPHVRILNTSFEHWRLKSNAFDLVISAEAFHWIPPEIGYPKAAAALKTGGSLALFWILSQNPDTTLSNAIDQIYRHHEPPLQNPDNAISSEWVERQITSNLKEVGGFDDITIRHYSWSVKYNSEQYIKLLSTFSDHYKLEKKTRLNLFADIQTMIERLGGILERHNLALLFHAKAVNLIP